MSINGPIQSLLVPSIPPAPRSSSTSAAPNWGTQGSSSRYRSYWPALFWASANHFSSVTPYSSSRNWTSNPPSALASGMIFSLNGVRPPSANAPMMTLPPAACAVDAEPPNVVSSARPAPLCSSSLRFKCRWKGWLSLILLSSLVRCPMHHGRTRRVEETRVSGVECHADGRADRRSKSSACAYREPLAADTQINKCLITHWLDG